MKDTAFGDLVKIAELEDNELTTVTFYVDMSNVVINHTDQNYIAQRGVYMAEGLDGRQVYLTDVHVRFTYNRCVRIHIDKQIYGQYPLDGFAVISYPALIIVGEHWMEAFASISVYILIPKESIILLLSLVYLNRKNNYGGKIGQFCKLLF